VNSSVVLVLTNSKDATSDYLCDKLCFAGTDICRFDTDLDCRNASYVYQDGVAYLLWNGRSLRASFVDAVIYRRPKQMVVSELIRDPVTREHAASEWSEAMEGFLAHIDEKKWINHPSRIYMSSHKVEQLTHAQMHGLRVPETVVTNDPDVASQFVSSQASGAVVKPLASGYIERNVEGVDTIIYTSRFQQADLPLLRDLGECPVLFQQCVPKVLDVRVTVIDHRSVAVGLSKTARDGKQELDIRRDNMEGVHYTVVQMPSKVEKAVQQLMTDYRLRFAAIDFVIAKNGEWFFLEVNPNGQWAWLDISANAEISDAFAEALRRPLS
jgi:glutathione synthase/RimK-type ligase-like ATP-grasp enzyme